MVLVPTPPIAGRARLQGGQVRAGEIGAMTLTGLPVRCSIREEIAVQDATPSFPVIVIPRPGHSIHLIELPWRTVSRLKEPELHFERPRGNEQRPSENSGRQTSTRKAASIGRAGAAAIGRTEAP